jgi:anti-sigma factor RsiW
MSVACEEVQELLPQYAEWGPRPAGAVEVHLASCARCHADLAAYRRMLSSLETYAGREEPAPEGYLERTMALIPQTPRRLALRDLRTVPGKMAAAAKHRPAIASLTGAAIGAAAIGLLVWRRRASVLQPVR